MSVSVDSGLIKEEDLTISQSKGVGTLRFMVPELFEVDDHGELIKRYNNKVDVYSFGIILIYIVTETYPRNYIKILSGSLPKLPTTVVEWVVELIHRCIQVSLSNRPMKQLVMDKTILVLHKLLIFGL